MKSARSFKEFEALNGISMEEVLTVFEAVSEAFPMIVAANLTKNTYTMIKDDGFLANDMPSSGKYDDLIDVGWKTYTRITSVRFWTISPGNVCYRCWGRDGKKSASSCIRRDGEITISGYPHM